MPAISDVARFALQMGEGIFDSGNDARSSRNGAAFAGAFDADRVDRRGGFQVHDLDVRHLGLGYTILPACGVRQLLKDKTVTASAIADYPITWLAAKPKNRPIGVAAQRFYDLLLEMGHEMRRQGVFRSVGPEAVSNRA